jgi:hypothetical protein
MTKREKPFVVFWHASGLFTIVPRGVAGWTQMAIWFALLLALAVWFFDLFTVRYDEPDFAAGVVLFLFGIVGWALGFLWWVFARAEQIDRVVWLRDQQRKQRKKGRQA